MCSKKSNGLFLALANSSARASLASSGRTIAPSTIAAKASSSARGKFGELATSSTSATMALREELLGRRGGKRVNFISSFDLLAQLCDLPPKQELSGRVWRLHWALASFCSLIWVRYMLLSINFLKRINIRLLYIPPHAQHGVVEGAIQLSCIS